MRAPTRHVIALATKQSPTPRKRRNPSRRLQRGDLAEARASTTKATQPPGGRQAGAPDADPEPARAGCPQLYSARVRASAARARFPGSSIGGKLHRYCNGTRFRIKPVGRRRRTAVIVVALRNGKQVHQVVRRR
jgi:hypothetical protein